jgi:CheY-like chemotaxis protein
MSLDRMAAPPRVAFTGLGATAAPGQDVPSLRAALCAAAAASSCVAPRLGYTDCQLPAKSGDAMQPSSISGVRHKVLYVEDQAVNALLMSALFERVSNCELVLADCAQSALALAHGLCPSLLLLDLRLPDMHGGELLLQLRRLPGCEHVPAIAVTADHGYDSAAAGFDELWHKPLNLLNVLERVQGYLELATVQRRTLLRRLEMPPLTTPALTARLTGT